MIEVIFFAIFSIATVASALSMIFQRSPVYSALSLIIVIAGLGGLFVMLNATFIAVLQIVIYAGAIMTLFLFVIMMVEVQNDPNPIWHRQSKLALLVLLLIAGITIWAISDSAAYFGPYPDNFSLKELARQLFTTHVLPFEAISILIIASVIGALYIARKENA